MDRFVGQPQFLKEVNYNIVNNLIAEKGPISKPQISQLTGLSLPTVNKIVYYLEDIGRIKEAGTTSGLGRKAVLYVTNEEMGNILTLSISDQSFTCCVVNMVGEIIHRFTMELDVSSREAAFGSTTAAIDRLMDNCSAKVVSIGIGLPGWVGVSGVVMYAPTVPVWNNVDLKQILTDRYKVPIYVESNVRYATIGYFDWVLKKECRDMVYISVGKELSSGLILNKKLYTGFGCFAGACGYMVTDELEKVLPQATRVGGSLEGKITRIVEEMNSTEEKERLLSLKRELALGLTSIIINYIAAVNPEVVVLGGSVLNKDFAKVVTELVGKYVPPQAVPSILIDSNSMSDTQGIISWCKARMNIGYNIIKDSE